MAKIATMPKRQRRKEPLVQYAIQYRVGFRAWRDLPNLRYDGKEAAWAGLGRLLRAAPLGYSLRVRPIGPEPREQAA